MKFRNGDKVIDKTRKRLWGEVQGTVKKSVGPYRTLVEWPDDRGTQLEKNVELEKVRKMSQHIVKDGKFEYVFGWDQPLQSFYLQKHDHSLPEDENPVVWLGTAGTTMYEVEDLVRASRTHGLHIDTRMRTRLYGEKDDGV